MSQAKQDIATCYHCGEQCVDEVIVHDEHPFCCQGCKTVYTLLNDTGLVGYYEIDEKSPGSTVNTDHSNKDFLDLEEVANKLIDFREGSSSKVTFYLPSMHCAACIWLLERMEKLNKGVYRSEVNFLRKELTVWFNEEVLTLKQLVILLEDLGYPPDLQRDLTSQKKNNPERRKLLLKLGVAGFAFGNIMLFSFPEYLSLEDASLDSFKVLFGYLNLVLALPVLFYSDTEYLRSAWKSLQLRYLTIDVPIALGIITLFSRSTYEIISGTGSGYFDSFAGLVFFLLVGKWYQSRTYEALAFDRDFRSYFPIAVTRLSNGEEAACMIEDIKVGDRLKILNNQVIPADAVLIKGSAAVDYSFVNGESDLVQKHEGDYLFAGGRQSGSSIEIELIKEVSQSYLTGLWNQSSFDENNEDTRFSGLIDKVSRVFSAAILTIALLTLVIRWWFELGETFNAFTAVLIIACPCALALSMPFAMGNVSRILGKLGFFVKNTLTIERLANVDTAVFDKTGTLTNAHKTKVSFLGGVLSEEQPDMVRSVVANSTHPLSIAVRQSLTSSTQKKVEKFEETAGKGIIAMVEGVEVKIGSRKLGDGTMVEPQEGWHSLVHIWIAHEYLGAFSIEKQVRKGIPPLIAHLKQRFQLHLLSGDNAGERERMVALFGEDSQLRFDQSPVDKLTYVEALQHQGSSVLMLGDGLNDAGALKAAHVGVAVADDVFSFSPACDAILQASNLRRLSEFLHYIRKSLNVVKVSIVISLLYNVVGLYFAVRGELTPVFAAILMPLSSVSVVGFVSLLTGLMRPR